MKKFGGYNKNAIKRLRFYGMEGIGFTVRKVYVLWSKNLSKMDIKRGTTLI